MKWNFTFSSTFLTDPSLILKLVLAKLGSQEVLGIFLYLFPKAGIAGMIMLDWLCLVLRGCWPLKLKSSCFYSKRSYSLNHLPSLPQATVYIFTFLSLYKYIISVHNLPFSLLWKFLHTHLASSALKFLLCKTRRITLPTRVKCLAQCSAGNRHLEEVNYKMFLSDTALCLSRD